MALANDTVSEIKGGFNKQIDAGAQNLMFEILQRHQYQFPIKSTIREIVCNGLDSVKERDTAMLIINNDAAVSDFYIERDGTLYKDSKFDPTYYDPQYLSTDSNVYIDYYEGREMEKDRVEIKDYGVGLWGQRLVGYWNLGYSTKRNSRHTIGKFGIGNKSPLSINDMFTTTTVYNGKKAKFNVYSSKVESITPRFNTETEKENEAHTVILSDGTPYTFYVEETDEKNSLTVTIEAKKFHKTQYIEAVQSQLLYFPNVILHIHDKTGHTTEEEVSSEVMYENEKIVISDNSYYSKPHVIVNGVNYGYINFDELELEEKMGNVGIKVLPEEVDISPSRESLIWNDVTKGTVLQRFKECADIATLLIQAELQEADFVKWLRVCINISSRHWNKSDVISRLANIVDVKSLAPKFQDTGLAFSHSILKPAHVRTVKLVTERKANVSHTKVLRDVVNFLGDSIHLPILHTKGNVSNRKDKYLLKKVYPNGFLIFQEYSEDKLYDILVDHRDQTESWEDLKVRAKKIVALLKASGELIDYEAIEVPADFKGDDSEEESEELEQEQMLAMQLSHEERRKIEGKTVLFTPRNKSDIPPQTTKFYEWQKIEIPFAEINDWEEEEIYYCTDKTADIMNFVALLTRDTREPSFCYPRAQDETYNSSFDGGQYDSKTKTSPDERYRCAHYFFNKQIKLVKVSKANSKYYRDFSPINEFFSKLKDNKITMSNILIKWNTARKILPLLNKVAFLYNYPFDEERRLFYRQVVKYVKNNYREVLSFDRKNATEENNVAQAHNDLVAHLDKVEAFQTFLQDSPTPEEIQEAAKEFWGNPSVTDAQSIDYDLWKKFQELLEWAAPVAVLLNQVDALTGVTVADLLTPNSYLKRKPAVSISEELEQEIRWFSAQKSVI